VDTTDRTLRIFNLSDISDLVAFLQSLTDDELLKNPALSPPR